MLHCFSGHLLTCRLRRHNFPLSLWPFFSVAFHNGFVVLGFFVGTLKPLTEKKLRNEMPSFASRGSSFPPHSAMHIEKGKTPSSSPPHPPSPPFLFALPLKSLARGMGVCRRDRKKIHARRDETSVCDQKQDLKPDLGRQKDIFVTMLTFPSPTRQASRDGGKPMGMFRSDQAHHTITSTAGSRHPSQQFPGARLAELCITRRICTNIVPCCSPRSQLEESVREGDGRRRSLVWGFIRCQMLGNQTKHKRWRLLLAPGFPRRASPAVLCCCVAPKLKGFWFCCARSDVSPRRPRALHRLLTQCH